MVHAADPCTRHQGICGCHSRGMPPSPHRWHRLEPALGPLQNQTTVGVAHYCWSASAAETSARGWGPALPPPEGWGTNTYPLFRAPYYRRYNYRKELQGAAPRPLYMRVSSLSREHLCAIHVDFVSVYAWITAQLVSVYAWTTRPFPRLIHSVPSLFPNVRATGP